MSFSSRSFSRKIKLMNKNNAGPRHQRTARENLMFPRSRLMIAVAALGALLSAGAAAQDYPTKPITLIVPWPAGGSTDISMRAIADSAAKFIGQPIVIHNKAAGGGTVGPATMAAAGKTHG